MKKLFTCLAVLAGLLCALNVKAQVPTVTSFSPLSGATGATVTITGTNFNATFGNNTVFFGATRATVSAGSTTSLTVTVPAGATYSPVTVTNTVPGLTASSARSFTPTFSGKTSLSSADFSTQNTITAGLNPFTTVIADLDNDGKPDLVSVNLGNNNLSLYRNISTAGTLNNTSFAAAVNFLVVSHPAALTVGDIDGDGKPDIMVSNSDASSVNIFRNTTTSGAFTSGSLGSSVTYTTPATPEGIVLRDLNNDGKPEMIVANNSGSISVFPNNSVAGGFTGTTFSAKTDFSTGGGAAIRVVADDFDGDGKIDIAAANFGGTVSLFRNNVGTGTINSSYLLLQTITASAGIRGIASGDLDADGKPEIIISNTTTSTLSVFRNNASSGTLNSSSFTKFDFASGPTLYNPAIGDLNGDSKPDIAVPSFNTAVVSVFTNTGVSPISLSSFAAKFDLTVGSTATTANIGDLDGDGKPDIVSSNYSGGTISLIRNNLIPLPVITSFTSPAGTGSGNNLINLPVLGGSTITITGTGFLAGMTISTGATGAVTVVSPTSATFTLAPGTQNATLTPTLTTTGGTSVASATLKYAAMPTLSSFISSAGTSTGSSLINLPIAGNVTITISGTNFISGMTISTGASGPVTVVSSVAATFLLAAGTQNTTLTPTITTAGGTTAPGPTLKYAATPTITSFTSASGNSSGNNLINLPVAGGVTVTITGSNFIPGMTISSGAAGPVTLVPGFETTKATFTLAAGTQNTILTPTVTTAGGTSVASATIRYLATPPVVSGISPSVTSANSPSVITITGSNFGNSLADITSITYGAAGTGGSGSSIQWISPTQIQFQPAPLTLGVANKVIVTILGQATTASTATFTAIAAPTVTSISPANVPFNNPGVVTLTGTGYGNSLSDITGITYGPTGTGASGGSIAWISSTTIQFTPAALTSGTAYKVIVTVGGQAQTPASVPTFTAYTPLPVISDFSPVSGPVGTSVTITGTGFNATTTNNIVFFGATRGTVTAASATSLSVTVPESADYQYITVLNTESTLAGYSLKPFGVTFTYSGGTLTYAPKTDFGVGSYSRLTIVKDLDGDGKADLAVANSNLSTVSILRNTSVSGTVTFSPKADLTSNSQPYSISAADLNGDGKPDLVVTNYNTTGNNVSVFRNTSVPGTISFAAKTDIAAGTNPASVAVGDVNGDGKPDLAVANYGSNLVSVFNNTSSGASISFAAKTDFATGTNPRAVAMGDIDGDGKPDLAVSNYTSSTMSVFLNTTVAGSISFAAKSDFPTGTNPQFVVIGDLDGDNKPDVATANNNSGNISVLRNTSVSGTPGFDAKIDIATGSSPYTIAMGDSNGDGKQDLTVGHSGTFYISILNNTSVSGSISFAAKSDYNVGVAPMSVSVNDIDGDGKPDIVHSASSGTTVSVLRSYVLVPAPTLASFSPQSGPAGTSVVLTGTNFNTTPADNVVFFGSALATVTAASATSLTVTVPAGTSYEYISVTNVTSGLTAYSSQPFGLTFTVTGGTVSFAPKTNFTTGATPRSLVVKDFDGDGKPDIAVANGTSTTMSVFRNTSVSGTPNFAAKSDFSTGTSPNFITAGDIDGDGKPDIAVANNGGSSISVFRNTSTPGNISFTALPTYLTATGPYWISIGDLNGDGRPEVAVANNNSNNVSVFNNVSVPGVIALESKVDFSTGTGPKTVTIGDIDGDGKRDLSIANYGGSSVSVLLNTTTSNIITFAAKTDFPTGTAPHWVSIGDLDGDSKPDLAVSNDNSSSVSLLRNTSVSGTASFSAKVDISVGANPYAVTMGDVDGDGKPDLAVTNYNNSSISTYNNASVSGTFSFTGKKDYGTGQTGYGAAIADIDGDAKPDLSFINLSGNTVSVMRNFVLASPPTLASISPISGDAGISVALTGTNFNTTAANNIVFFGASMAVVTAAAETSLTVTVPTGANYQYISVTNISTGLTAYSTKPFGLTFTTTGGVLAFTPKTDLTADPGPRSVIVKDFDGDGKPDLAAATATVSTVGIYRNTSTPGVTSFAAKVALGPGGSPFSVVADDIDGDGKPDVITANSGSSNISVIRNTSVPGTISFAARIDYSVGSTPYMVATGDLNGDGRPEIAVANSGSNSVSVFGNNSIPGIIELTGKIDLTTATGPRSVAIGDIDGNNVPDIAAANFSSTSVSVFRNTTVAGSMSFTAKTDFTTGSQPQGVSIGDIDGDGKADLAIPNYNASTVSVLRNTSVPGTVTFAGKSDFSVGVNPFSVTIGDTNGDGKPDLAVANSGSANSFSILRNTSVSGTVSFAPKSDISTGTTPYSVAVGDIDGDGRPDFSVANNASNTVSVFRSYTLVAPSTFSSFSPQSGPAGTSVTITGTNFNATAANNVIFFGSVMATVTAATTTSLTVTVPAASSYQYISVTNISTGHTAYSSSPFIVTFTVTGGTLALTPKTDFPTGNTPRSVTVKDLDGDGKPDLAVANSVGNSASVFLNTSVSGSTSFTAQAGLITGLSPYSLIANDLDGDGKPDLAVANFGSTSISVFRNTSTTGAISFSLKNDYTTASLPYYISAGDLNADGKPELAVTNAGSSSVSIFSNISVPGIIGFMSKADFSTSSTPRSVAIGDVDGDNLPDLAVANFGANTVSVLRNTTASGSISFASLANFNTGSSPNWVAIGDIDGDGKADLATANNSGGNVSLLRNTSSPGAPSFATKIDITTGSTPYSVSMGDINGDGKPDLAVTNSGSNSVSVMNNTSVPGEISFAAKSDLGTGSTPNAVAIADIDGDGKPDVSLVNNVSATFSVLRSYVLPAPPTFTSFSPQSGAAGSNVTITGTNFNTTAANNVVFFGSVMATVTSASSTSLDVTVPSSADYQYISVTNIISGLSAYSSKPFGVTFTLAAGTPSFSPKSDFTTVSGPRGVVAKDFDGDGKADLAVTNSFASSISVFRNTSTSGTTGFAAKADFTVGLNPYHVASVDFDGDGKPDIATANQGNNTVSVLRNTSVPGTISFAAKDDFTTGSGQYSIAVGDLNLDGRPEMVVVNGNSNNISVFVNSSVPGTIGFAPKADFTTGSNPRSVVAGDIDGDGLPDLAVSNISNNTVSILRNTTVSGSLSFAAKSDFTTGSGPFGIGIGDLDGDGKADLAITNNNTGTISILRNTSVSGTPAFNPKVDITVGSEPYSVAIGDMDGDGKPDLAVSNSSGSTVSVLNNTSVSGTISFIARPDLSPGATPYSAVIADIDGDGKPDISVANGSSNTVSVLRSYVLPAPPTFTSFSPESGIAGSSVTITGTNFSTTAANNVVFFGSVMATVTSASASSISVTVPAGANYQYVSVTNTDTKLSAYSSRPFGLTFSGGPRSFDPKIDFSAGNQPNSVAMADMDGDGKPDMAVVSGGQNSIYVFRNTSVPGSTSFAAQSSLTTGSTPYKIIAADLDGDGKADLAVTNLNNSSFSVFRNISVSGTISFATKSDYTTDYQPWSIAFGDINSDGRPELVVTGSSTNKVSVFANNSAPQMIGFGSKMDFTTGSDPRSVAVGDIDGDGLPDLAVTNFSANSVSLFRNTTTSGSISFAAKADFATGTNPQSVVIGDLDGDNKADLAVANNGSATVSLIRNTSSPGTIAFDNKIDLVSGSNTYSVAIGDVNGDGKPDLAVNGSTALSYFNNTSVSGIFSFVPKSDYPIGTQSYSSVIGDIDGDGRPDIATGTANSALAVFHSFTALSPTISSISANSGVSGTNITITGTNFSGVSTVSFGGAPATSFNTTSLTSITASVGNGASGNVSVTTPGGTATFAGFTFTPSSNSDLSALTISSGSLSPAFATNTISYSASVPNASSTITLTATGVHLYPLIQVRVNGGTYVTVPNGAPSTALALNTGPNTVEVKVTAQDGINTKTYTLTITRALSSNAYLTALTLSAGSLSPLFWGDEINYTVTTTNGSTTVTPLVADMTAAVTVNGTPVVSGNPSGSINLNIGANVITTVVTSEIGTTKTYTVTVTRRVFDNVTATVAAALQGVSYSNVSWADYDSDGDMDFLLTGSRSNTPVSELWKNTAGVFTNVTSSAAPSLPAIKKGSSSWGDYDSDGDMDLIMTGEGQFGNTVFTIRSNNNGILNNALQGTLAIGAYGFAEATVIWTDFDKDGDLDFIMSGIGGSSTSKIELWRNGTTGTRGDFVNKTTSFISPSLLNYVNTISQPRVTVGDYDNDSDPDLLINGLEPGNISSTKILRNGTTGETGVFTDVSSSVIPGIQGAYYSDAKWVDYDNDGDLDFMFNGIHGSTGTLYTQLWRNNLGTSNNFTNVTSSVMPGIPNLYQASFSWGDLDNDGDQDLILNGVNQYNPSETRIAQIWINGPGNIFTNQTSSFAPGLPASKTGSIATADYDNDGRLDFIITGAENSTEYAQIWHNSGGFTPNAVPSAPFGLSSVAGSPGKVTLNWGVANDDTTPSAGLRYNLRVGTTSGGNDLLSSQAGSTGFLRSAITDTKALSSKLAALPEGTYYWSVQAIDNNSAGGSFSAEQSFSVLPMPFTDHHLTAAPGLVGSGFSNVKWGDYDNDGDLDFIFVGNAESNAKTQIWKNTGGTFSNVTITGDPLNIAPGLPAGSLAMVSWGDIDKDGDLDFILATNQFPSTLRIWRNNASIFTDITSTVAPGLQDFQDAAGSFSDIDNDGDMDLIVTGRDVNNNNQLQVWTNASGTFNQNYSGISIGPNAMGRAKFSWADYDHDGDKDLLISGHGIYQNNNGNFDLKTHHYIQETSIAPGLIIPEYAQWGDYDNDGYQDFVVNGYSSSFVQSTQIWHNDFVNTGKFVEVTSTLAPDIRQLTNGESKWVDVDNDGDLDLMINGSGTGNIRHFQIMQNGTTGTAGIFTDQTASYIRLEGFAFGAIAPADYDQDGDVDFITTGASNDEVVNPTGVWRNNSATANTPPSAPTALNSVVNPAFVTLNWAAASDNNTPVAALSYNVRVGTTASGSEIILPYADNTTGLSKIVTTGNANNRLDFKLFSLTPGKYYWSVQGIDNNLQGGSFAAEQTFTVAGPPIVTSVAASSMTTGTVTLNGLVDDAGANTTVSFEYGTSAILSGATTIAATTGGTITAGTGATAAAVNLSGLLPNTTYYFRVNATNSLGTSNGAILSFTTLKSANLSALAISSGTLSPAFDPGTLSYTAQVINAVSSITITPTAFDAGATIKVNGNTVASGSASGAVTLALGSNTILVEVTAQDGMTVKTYTIDVNRDTASDNADLSALSLSAGTLSPAFASATTAYTASVNNAATSLTITPAIAESHATVKVNGVAVTSGNPSGSINLIVGDNTITTEVTAQDGTTIKTYTVIVNRAPSINADLSALSISSGTLSPAFASATGSYTASVDNLTSSITITPTVADATATVKVNGITVTSGSPSGSIPLTVGSNNTITTVVTAQDGTTIQTYTVTVTRAIPPLPYSESFKYSTAAGMVYGGTPAAAITGGSIDAQGAGYLRLTTNTLNQLGFARNTIAFPSVNGLSISFEYYTHSGSGGDGLTFFLYDATASPFAIGAPGGSLGYAQTTSSGGLPGVSKGYIGIGFDEAGNFSNPTLGRQGGPGQKSNSVTLRGDGNGAAAVASNYEYLTGIQTSDAAAMTLAGAGPAFNIWGANGRSTIGVSRPQGGLLPTDNGYRKAKIELTPNGLGTGFIVNVWIIEGNAGGGTLHHLITDYSYVGSTLPSHLSYGFSAATGGYSNMHEIRNLDITVPTGAGALEPTVTDIIKNGSENSVVPFTTLNFATKYSSPTNIPLSKIKVLSLPANGTLKLSGTDISVNQEIPVANLSAITFVPNGGFNGSTIFQWNGSDGTSYAASHAYVTMTLAPAGTTAFPYYESFKNSTAAGLVLGGTPAASLTAATTDSEGAGYLRLTNNLTGQSGFARNTREFPTAEGFSVSFEYYTYGGTAADGISFFLYDATANGSFQIGAPGSSLGYAQNSVLPGVSKGYLGIGLDEFGGFSTGTGGRMGGPGSKPSSVTIRGDGNGLGGAGGTNYEYLTNIQTSNGAAMSAAGAGTAFQTAGGVNGRTGGGLTPTSAGYRKAKIEMTPNATGNGFILNVWITEGNAAGPIEHHVITDHNYLSTSLVPANLSYGFAGSTGGYTNFHEIRNLEITLPGAVSIPAMMAVDNSLAGNNMLKVWSPAPADADKKDAAAINQSALPAATNILSPNKDGKNDTWVIRNLEKYPTNTVTIVDRNGKVVYRKENYRNDWDGTFRGTVLAEDTYYYIVEFGKGISPLRGFISVVK